MIADRRIARRYADALCQLAQEQDVIERVRADLDLVVDTLNDHPELSRFLHHQRVSPAQKRELLDQTFGERISSLTRGLLHLLVDKHRETLLPVVRELFVIFANELRGIVDVEVRSAKALDDPEKEALREKLVKITGREVRILEEHDPELLGGLIVRIGDLIMDGSVSTRLTRLGEQLRQARLKNVG